MCLMARLYPQYMEETAVGCPMEQSTAAAWEEDKYSCNGPNRRSSSPPMCKHRSLWASGTASPLLLAKQTGIQHLLGTLSECCCSGSRLTRQAATEVKWSAWLLQTRLCCHNRGGSTCTAPSPSASCSLPHTTSWEIYFFPRSPQMFSQEFLPAFSWLDGQERGRREGSSQVTQLRFLLAVWPGEREIGSVFRTWKNETHLAACCILNLTAGGGQDPCCSGGGPMLFSC